MQELALFMFTSNFIFEVFIYYKEKSGKPNECPSNLYQISMLLSFRFIIYDFSADDMLFTLSAGSIMISLSNYRLSNAKSLSWILQMHK